MEWQAASVLAGLPGMPNTKSGVIRRASREAWRSRPRKGRGGGREYHFFALPVATQKALVEASIRQGPGSTVGTPPRSAPTASLTQRQRACMEARAAILMEAERIAETTGVDRAVSQIAEMASRRTLPTHLMALISQANSRAGREGRRDLSVRTIKRWRALLRDRGLIALAPISGTKPTMPPWATALLIQWRQPQKPCLTVAVRALHQSGSLPEGVTPPSYSQARRFLRKVGEIEKLRGRKLARALQGDRPFVRRDTSKLRPTDVYIADGHTFDAEVAHPEHRRPFRPEITMILDVATRRAVGWSAAFSESSLAVLDALRYAVTTCGIPAIFYVDRGSGYRNQMMQSPATGMMGRLGITMEHSRPYNSQARGIIERAHRTILVEVARRLPTYIGQAMDPEARKIAFKSTRKDGRGLVRWPDLLAHIQAQVDEYNNQPHRSLPRMTDPATGTRRHQTPHEAWVAAVEGGAEIVMPEHTEDLFRPQVTRTVRRGEISLFGNLYFSVDLEEWHGQAVRVAYDVHDAGRVWVSDPEGRIICVAEADGNRRDYYPISYVESRRDERAKGRRRRLQAKMEEVEAEHRGSPELAHAEPTTVELEAAAELVRDLLPREEGVVPQVVRVGSLTRPMFAADADKYEWLMGHEGEIDDEDRDWLAWYRNTQEWVLRFGGQTRSEQAW